MEPKRELLWLMVHELGVQCRLGLFRLMDALDIERSIAEVWSSTEDDPHSNAENFSVRMDRYNTLVQRLHLAAHDFLTHAANVSKIFFPDDRGTSPSEKQARWRRGEVLRADFGINRAMQIVDRNLRNDVEHFDERLERWFVENGSTSADMWDLGFQPFGSLSPGGFPPPDLQLRNFGSTGEYLFRGRSYNLWTARTELESILRQIPRWYEQHPIVE